MNLRELSIFVSDTMDDRLAECGIDSNQIIQIKIQDRKLPPDDNVVWNVVWIIVCYMNDNLDRDLSIEIMGNSKGMMAI